MAEQSPEILALEVDIWKKVIDVQLHFNDLELRIRNFAVSLLVGAIGAAGLAMNANTRVTLFGTRYLLAPFVLVAGLVGWLSFYAMDRFWYHNLLQGAVRQARTIEERLKATLPGITLSTEIRKASPSKLGNIEIHSSTKMNIFYLVIAAVLLVLIVVLFSK
jgi:hypothetical protein